MDEQASTEHNHQEDYEYDYSSELENNDPNQSDIECKVNEFYRECGSQCGQSCRLMTHDLDEPCTPQCKPGCYCEKGLLRNEAGVCVPEEQCICRLHEKKCENPNEQYFWCFNECGRTCFDFKLGQDADCPSKCSRGCFCKMGYVRNENGLCVREEECILTKSKIVCNKNEDYSDCGSDCGRNCRDLNKSEDDSQCFSCESGCFCQKGYYRSDEGSCLMKSECVVIEKIGSTDCEGNEEYTDCGNFCIENCENVGRVERAANCPFNCEKGCVCRQGFKRNINGLCVPKDKCNDWKPSCNQNEEYTECGSKCGQECSDLAKTNLTCPLVCEAGCFCKTNFYRNGSDVCVAKNECEVPPMECPDREVYRNCGKRCGESCGDLRNSVNCSQECEEGCYCQKGFFRDIYGNCVDRTECDLDPKQVSSPDCPSNEIFKKCGKKCDESCEQRIGCKSDCQTGCFCAQGYLRHKSGKCVVDDQCAAPEQCVQCEQNEYYTDCGSDCGNFCTVLLTDQTCEKSCRKGCFCKYGYHRNDLGKCVIRDQC